MPPPPHAPDVVITGLGLVTPLGHSAWSTLTALMDGRTTADRLSQIPERADPTTLARATAGVGFGALSRTDPTVELAERAGREALADAGLGTGDEDTGLVIASSKGAVVSLLGACGNEAQMQCTARSPHGLLAHHISMRLALGVIAAPVAACATALIAIHLARREIQAGRRRRILIVAVESAMHPLFVHSYKRLGVLAPVDPPSAHRARPLDQARNGFTLNECAAAVVLESEPAGRRRIHARLGRSAAAAQPTDLIRAPQTMSSLRALIKRLALSVDSISLAHPHATGTIDNDARELAAMAEALGERAAGTPIYASKGAVGHGLGAAGLVNVVLGCLFARIGARPPMPWLRDPIDSPFDMCEETRPVQPGAQLCLAAGFGGHLAGVVFETPG